MIQVSAIFLELVSFDVKNQNAMHATKLMNMLQLASEFVLFKPKCASTEQTKNTWIKNAKNKTRKPRKETVKQATKNS